MLRSRKPRLSDRRASLSHTTKSRTTYSQYLSVFIGTHRVNCGLDKNNKRQEFMRWLKSLLLLLAIMLLAGCAATPDAGGDRLPSSLRLDSYPGDTGVRRTDQTHERASRGAGGDSTTERPAGETASAAQSGGDASPPSEAQLAGSASAIVLGEGDVIEFRMFGQPEMTTTAYISGQGTVSLPLLQQVEVGGLTPGEVEVKVADAYRAGGYFNDPQVNINIAQYRSQQIAVLGEVDRAGRYPLETRTGVLDALAQAGGVTPRGSGTVTIIRQTEDGTRRFRLSLDRLVAKTGDLDGFKLVAGDTVFVPEAPLFYIYGEVRRPDAYAIRPGMMVMQAITMGGGLTERGSNSRIVIHREEDGATQSFAPELTDIIQPDDVIFVKERFF